MNFQLLTTFLFACLLNFKPTVTITFLSLKKHDHKSDSIIGTPKKAIAKLKGGHIQGYVVLADSENSKSVNVFKGVPFAAPPVNNLRYKLPKPAKKWEGTWNATYYRPACPSNTSQTTSPQKSINEDCLYANIFADRTCQETKKCPVFYIIHGGGFFYDSATMFNDSILIDRYASQEIVVVIPAYRLGILGFADLGNDDLIPRNLGLYDIVHALKWVQDEIEAFGGDPNQVTLFGISAGGSAIAYLSVAPNVEKLWSRAVIISPVDPLWKNSNYNVTGAIIRAIGCARNESYNWHYAQALEAACLQKQNYTTLMHVSRAVEPEYCFEGISIDSYMFDNTWFSDLLKNYKAVPTLFGSTRWEFNINDKYDTVLHYCRTFSHFLDYHSDAVISECAKKYNTSIYSDYNHNPVARDGVRAFIYQLASTVTAAGKEAHIYSFELENHDFHASELTFAFGMHPIKGRKLTWKEALMMEYYPRLLKSFIKGKNIENYVVPFKNDRNYEVLEFTNISGTLRGPTPILQRYFPETLNYWLGYLGEIEKTEMAMKKKNDTERFYKKWSEIQENKLEEQRQKFRKVREHVEVAGNISVTKKEKVRKAKEEQFLNFLLRNSLKEVASGLKDIIKVKEKAGEDTSHAKTVLVRIEELSAMNKEMNKKLNATKIKINNKLDSSVYKFWFKPAIDESIYQKVPEFYNVNKSVNDEYLEVENLKNKTTVTLSERWNSTMVDLETKRKEVLQKLKKQVANIENEEKLGDKYSFKRETARINISAELKETLQQIRSEVKAAFEKTIAETENNYSQAMQKLKNKINEIVLKTLQGFKQLKNETLQSVRLNMLASQTSPFILPVLGNTFEDSLESPHRISEDARETWSGFWIVATIVTMVAATLMIMTITNWFKSRREIRGGYYYNEDSRFFTEKSRIVLANLPKYSDL